MYCNKKNAKQPKDHQSQTYRASSTHINQGQIKYQYKNVEHQSNYN